MNLLNSFSLKIRVILIVVLALVICSSVSIAGFLYFNNQELYRGVIEKSRAIHLRLDAAVTYVALQQGLEPAIKELKQKYHSHEQITKEDKAIVLKQVPIVAAMKIGAMDADKDNYEFRVFSDNPRNEGNQATPKELEIFNKFENDSSLKEQIINTGDSISIYRPVRLSKEKGCLNCHGDPAESPWKNGRDILGYQMENWKEGKLHGVFEIKTDLLKLAATNGGHNTISPKDILIVGILISGVIGVFVAVLLLKKPLYDLNNLANSLDKSGKDVGNEAVQISSYADELAQASTEQAASLQQTSSSIEQISSMINNNSENSIQATLISEQSLLSAQKGKDVVESMIGAIGDIDSSNICIAKQIDETNKEIERIVKIINEIGSKTKVINEIAFQTKLLSFNASVEAARAGESGKGFAVVAEEVGNLAAISGGAAKEITEMLVESTQTVEEIVKNSKEKIGKLILEGKIKVENGTRIASECEDTFNEILENISNVSKMISEISNASQEQSQGVREINKAMGQLDHVTHQNTANASTSAQSAGVLAEQAEQLNSIVTTLVVMLRGA